MRPVPKEILAQHVVILGKTRSGKSSVMRGLVEDLLDRQQPVCIVDPKGDWWGIKLAADGKGPGYPVVTFGGEHGDIPLNEHAGAHVAELFATGNRPCLIDLGGWMPGPRTKFWIDFASSLFKHTRGERWLAVDEIHNFAPKGKIFDVDAGKALHWTNRLASEGLGKGVALLFASQRPQKVHNDTLTSAETLIAMRVIHPSDRAAVAEWIKGCGDSEGSEVLNSLAQMDRGEGWVWSPEIGFGPKRVQFPMFKTYDSFRAQSAADAKKLKGWAEVDLDEVRAKLASVVEQAKAEDPRELRKQIADLKKQTPDIARCPSCGTAPPRGKFILPYSCPTCGVGVLRWERIGEKKAGAVEKPVLTDADRARLDKLQEALNQAVDAIATRADVMLNSIAERAKATIDDSLAKWSTEAARARAGFVSELEKPSVQKLFTKIAAASAPAAPRKPVNSELTGAQLALRQPVTRPVAPARVPVDGEITIGRGGDYRMLVALAQNPDGLTPSKLSLLSGIARRGGTFRTYLGKLLTGGFAVRNGHGQIRITETGVAVAGDYDPLPTGAALIDYWRRELGDSGMRAMFDAIVAVYPDSLTAGELSERTNIAEAGGTFRTYLGKLKTLELVAGNRHALRAADELFD